MADPISTPVTVASNVLKATNSPLIESPLTQSPLANSPLVESLSFIQPDIIYWQEIFFWGSIGLVTLLLSLFFYIKAQRKFRYIRLMKKPQRLALKGLKRAYKRRTKTGYISFAFSATNCLKKYLDGRYHIGVRMLSSRQGLEVINDKKCLEDSVLKKLERLFGVCDGIKYRCIPSSDEEITKIFKRSISIVKTTRWTLKS